MKRIEIGLDVVIHVGDVIDGLRQIPDGTVQCCVSSPPYWGLRQYLFNNAVCLRDNLTPEEVTFVLKELEEHGIKPRK